MEFQRNKLKEINGKSKICHGATDSSEVLHALQLVKCVSRAITSRIKSPTQLVNEVSLSSNVSKLSKKRIQISNLKRQKFSSPEGQ